MDEERLLSSPIDFGICTVQFPSMKACYKTKSEMERGHMLDYLLASSACFPVFPMTEIMVINILMGDLVIIFLLILL